MKKTVNPIIGNSIMEDVEKPIPGDADSKETYGSDSAVAILHQLGYRYVAINPGSSFRGLHDSIVNYGGNRNPKLLLCLHEEVAISLAHGYAKAGGSPIAVAIHDLVGLMHASMAVYDAYLDQIPMVILGGSGPRNQELRRPIDWIHSADSQSELIRSFVKWDNEPSPASSFSLSIVKAHQIANSRPYGPTYISLDSELQESSVDFEEIFDTSLFEPSGSSVPADHLLQQAVDLLSSAKLPLVIGGRNLHGENVTKPLIEIVESLGAAYKDDRNSVSFPTDHPNNCNLDSRIIEDSDVILCIEVPDICSTLGIQINQVGNRFFDDKVIIHMYASDSYLRSWSNASSIMQPASLRLQCDPISGLNALTAALRSKLNLEEADTGSQRIINRMQNIPDQPRLVDNTEWDSSPISQKRLVAETWEAVKDLDYILALRNTRSWPEGIWKFNGAGQYLGHSGGGGVGYGPGALVGAALAAREQGKLGIGIIGDGDFLMASSALWTAVHYQIPLLMIINDNSSFYNDEPHQARIAQKRGRPSANSWIGMRIDNPTIDLAGLARSYGSWSIGPIDRPLELSNALEEAVERALSGSVAVVHVRTTR